MAKYEHLIPRAMITQQSMKVKGMINFFAGKLECVSPRIWGTRTEMGYNGQ